MTRSTVALAFAIIAAVTAAGCKKDSKEEPKAADPAPTAAAVDPKPTQPTTPAPTPTTPTPTPTADPAPTPVATGDKVVKPPVDCESQEKITIANAIIDAKDGIAVKAEGQCKVTITSSVLIGKPVAIHVEGQAKVDIIDSEATGTEAGARVEGQANLNAKGSVFKGAVPVDKQGLADVRDDGGNTW